MHATAEGTLDEIIYTCAWNARMALHFNHLDNTQRDTHYKKLSDTVTTHVVGIMAL